MPTPKTILLRMPALILAAILALPICSLDAAKKKEQPKYEFTIPVQQVPRYLTAEQLREWRELRRNIELAQADIETGEWLAAKEYSAFVSDARIKADRKKGEDLIKDAKARLETFTAEQNKLRQSAEELLKERKAQFQSQQFELVFDALHLDSAAKDTTEAMLYKLWNQNYSKLLFAGAYVFNDGYYSKNQELSEDVMTIIAKLDGNRYTLEEDITDFSINYDGAQPKIDFEDSDKMVDKFKSALLIIEILFDQESTNGLYALHAIDLKSGKLIEQMIISYPVDGPSKELLGVNKTASAPEPAKPAEKDGKAEDKGETVTAEAKPEPKEAKPESNAPLSAIKLVLNDDKNFLGRLGNARDQYVFDISYVGQIDGYDQRAAVLLNKALMREQGLRVDDMEFITLALKSLNDDAEPDSYSNAVWRVAPTTPVDFGMGEYAVQALAEQNGQTVSVDIGQLTIESVDPKSIPPQAANH